MFYKSPVRNLSTLKHKNCSVHAEINVLNKAMRDTNVSPTEITIVVIRVSSKGQIKGSEPCTGCKKYLTRKGVRKVYYS